MVLAALHSIAKPVPYQIWLPYAHPIAERTYVHEVLVNRLVMLDLLWSKLPLRVLKIDGYCCDHSSAFIFDWIFFILAGNKDNHKSKN